MKDEEESVLTFAGFDRGVNSHRHFGISHGGWGGGAIRTGGAPGTQGHREDRCRGGVEQGSSSSGGQRRRSAVAE